MNNFIYISLGMVDAFAALSLILKLFMLPVGQYRFRLFAFAAFISLLSFFMRVVIGLPALDLPLQYIFFVLFFRFVMQLKVHIAAFIAGTGLNAYAVIQLAVYYLYTWTGVAHTKILSDNVGLQLYIVQATAIATAIVFTLFLSRFGHGFSFIVVPPHDFLRQENYLSNKNIAMISASIVSLLTVCITIALLYAAKPLGLMIAAATAFGLSFYFSKWSDKDDARKAIAAYRDKNKAL